MFSRSMVMPMFGSSGRLGFGGSGRRLGLRSRLMLATGVIHEEAGNWRRPVLQHTNKAVIRNVLCDLLFKCES